MRNNIKGEKMQWIKPELIVLVRSNPEESVLTRCSTSRGQPGFPTFCPSTQCNSSPGSCTSTVAPS
jgi:hypothetical protein